MEAYDPRDLTIHLKDALLYILMRWKLLVSAALAGAILLTVGQYVAELSRYRAQPSATDTLTAEGRARVAAAVSYEAAYRRLCAYNESASLMHIDPGATPTRRMRLLVTGENALAAAGLYRDAMTAESLYRDIAEGAQAAYMAELVTVTVENETAQQPLKQAFLSVQVVAPTEEVCGRLSAAVHRCAEEVQAAVFDAVGTHTARWVVDRYAVVRDEVLPARQQASFEEQSRLQAQAATARQALTAQEERVYWRQLDGTAVTEERAAPRVSHKAWLWGFLLGGGIGLLALSVGYLFCGRVLSAADVAGRHKVAVVGVLGKSRPLQDAAEDRDLVWRRLAVAAQKRGVSHLFLAAEEGDWSDLSAVLGEYAIALSVGGAPTADGGAAQKLAACDGCVLGLYWGRTRHDRVAQEIALARQWDIPLLGVVLLQ